MNAFSEWIILKCSQWLKQNESPRRAYLCDFEHIKVEIRQGDILLIEGRNRIGHIISQITRSPWSHAALYIGKRYDIENDELRAKIEQYYSFSSSENPQLLIESELGEGTIISLLTKYTDDHIRILRPQGIGATDIQKIIRFAINRLGVKYNVRHVFDLARLLLPWGLFPRKWRSSLFSHHARHTEDICSSMIADAFHSVGFPILPLVQASNEKNLELIQRNPRLFTPSDFDYSPYFNVIKYPIFKIGDSVSLQELPWKKGETSDN